MSEAAISAGLSAGVFLGTGRRKTAVARVRVRAGGGQIMVNGRPFDQYFLTDQLRKTVEAPLVLVGKRSEVDVIIRVEGGGPSGQADACKLGIARALKQCLPECESALRDGGMLTRDSRMKERKKYGLRGARRGTQFSKR